MRQFLLCHHHLIRLLLASNAVWQMIVMRGRGAASYLVSLFFKLGELMYVRQNLRSVLPPPLSNVQRKFSGLVFERRCWLRRWLRLCLWRRLHSSRIRVHQRSAFAKGGRRAAGGSSGRSVQLLMLRHRRSTWRATAVCIGELMTEGSQCNARRAPRRVF